MFHTIVVGADDSQTARQAVVAAADIAQMSGGSLVIVTAYDPKSVRLDDLPPELRLATAVHPADQLLRSLSAIGQERGLPLSVEAVTGSPADAVVKVAEQRHADLIVVGNKGMKGTRRVLGSVPNSIAHAAPCSVLIVDTEAAGS
jgi:nucleotide-binding universal stress UspA family protein